MELINAITKFNESSQKEIDKIVCIIKKCKGKVIFTGIGKNSFIAAKEAATFSSIGIPSFYVDAVHMVHGDFGMIEKNDVVIALSKSGNTSELCHTLDYMYKNIFYSKLITIDFNENSEISKYSDAEIHLPKINEMDQWDKVPTNSILFMQYVIDKIGIKVMNKKNFKLTDFVKTHPGGSIGKTKVG